MKAKAIWKNLWKTKGGKAWVIVTPILLVLMIVVISLSTGVGLFYGTINLVFGGERIDMSRATYAKGAPYYESSFETKKEVSAHNTELVEEIAAQGIVLLKNTDDTLPLKKKPKISVFGKNSVNMVYGGSGSGGRDASSAVNLYKALENAEIEYNPTLKSFYDGGSSGSGRPASPNFGVILTGFPTGETPVSNYGANVISSYDNYKDAALIVLSRIGGEGYDLPRTMFYDGKSGSSYSDWGGNTVIPGAYSRDSHYLELDRNETDLIKHVCDQGFEKVIIVLNCGTSMELGFLESSEFWMANGGVDYSEKIGAALWAGNPGEAGNNALAKILVGDINPSGRTVDTFVKDFEQDPTWYNFGNNREKFGNEYYISTWGASAVPAHAYFVRYEEGIYSGYRYWETRGEEEGGMWYDNNVVYPFGYGLSYIDSEDWAWEVKSVAYADGSTFNNYDDLKKDGELVVTVNVKNNGSIAGRDVVELYYTPQYYVGEIEKAHVNLVDFAKTGIIQPGGDEDVTLKVKASAMASYDYNDANGNGHKGYELESGSEYMLRVSRSAHEHMIEIPFGVTGTEYNGTCFTYDEGVTPGSKVENRFDEVSDYITEYTTRADFEGTLPKEMPRARGVNIWQPGAETDEFFRAYYVANINAAYDKDQPWFVEDNKKPTTGKRNGVKLEDLVGLDYDDDKWDDLLDQLTVAEMNELIGIGAFTTQQVGSAQKPKTYDFDGPGGFVIGSFMSAFQDNTVVCFWPCESLIAATWSKDIAYDMGVGLGEEGLWGSDSDDYTFSGWYAPACNIHRSQFGGRNFEYYSEDPVLSGVMAAGVCKGARSKGLITYVKHFAVNDMETNRSDNGISVWLNEQSLREIYLRPFEYAVKEGETLAMMSSFNRIGRHWAGGSYALLTEILRNEWGFRGMVLTDYNNGAGSYMDLDLMIRAGGDLNLFQSSWLSTSGKSLTATHLTAMRNASHNILYATANSMAMNNPFGPTLLPIWVIIMICICVAIFVGLAVWGFFMIWRAVKATKADEAALATAPAGDATTDANDASGDGTNE